TVLLRPPLPLSLRPPPARRCSLYPLLALAAVPRSCRRPPPPPAPAGGPPLRPRAPAYSRRPSPPLPSAAPCASRWTGASTPSSGICPAALDLHHGRRGLTLEVAEREQEQHIARPQGRMAADIRWRPIRASWTSLHGGAPLRIGTNCSEQVVLHPDQALADLEIAGACCARQAIVDGRR
ncbi:unnamed protein product, partial [Urochloa humidicola]